MMKVQTYLKGIKYNPRSAKGVIKKRGVQEGLIDNDTVDVFYINLPYNANHKFQTEIGKFVTDAIKEKIERDNI